MPFDVWPWQTIGHLYCATSNFMHYFVAIGEFELELQSGNGHFGSKSTIFLAVSPCNVTYDLENNTAPLLCYLKLCASFFSHWWIQTWVTVQKRPIWVKIDDLFSSMTLQFDVWPWKTIGHLFYATSSLVHHFVAIGDFKLEKQSRNVPLGSKSMIFRAVWHLQFYVWLWKTIGHLISATSSFMYHFVAIGEFKLELQSGNTLFGSKSKIF